MSFVIHHKSYETPPETQASSADPENPANDNLIDAAINNLYDLDDDDFDIDWSEMDRLLANKTDEVIGNDDLQEKLETCQRKLRLSNSFCGSLMLYIYIYINAVHTMCDVRCRAKLGGLLEKGSSRGPEEALFPLCPYTRWVTRGILVSPGPSAGRTALLFYYSYYRR